MNKFILTLSILAIYIVSFGQQGDGGTPEGLTYFMKSGIEVPNYSFKQPDIEALRAEDRINDSLKTGPWRFGFNNSTSLDLYNSGVWSTRKNGDKIWIMQISSSQAKTINLTFSNTTIPDGNELYVYNPEKTFILGKFIQNHIYKGELGTELIPGDAVIVEYYVPARNSDNIGNIQVSTVTHGYRTAQEYQTKAFGGSGNCNMNVNCPDGAPYVNQRNSAILLVSGGSGFCSGALINNTQFDGTPYVLTANHCYSSGYANWVFRFNWQSSGCSNPGSSPSFESLSGAALRARRAPSDFMLLEITGGLTNGTVPESHSPFFAGWNNGNAAPSSSFSIHHPSGDIKKIAFDDDPATVAQAMGSSEANSSWGVIWDRNTTTEGGSSGSPLFNQKGQIIGQLWGGNAGCTGPSSSSGQDFYGRLHNSWNPTGSSNAQQLKHWLDPTNVGGTSIIGYDPYAASFALDASVINVIGFEDNLCSTGFYPSVVVMNSGSTDLTSFTVNYTYNGLSGASYNWSGNLTTNQSTTIQLPWMFNVNGTNTIKVEVTNPNGQTDENTADNEINVDYQAISNGLIADFNFYLGCYVNEVSWELKDDNSNVLYSGDGYSPVSNSNYLVSEEFCLSNGCYELILYDTYGDGVFGSNQSGCNYDGSMTLVQRADDQILAELPMSQANFGYTRTFNFCVNNVSLAINEMDANVSIYPNPSKGVFNITMDFEGIKNVTLTSLTGKVVGAYQLTENELQINESQLAAGVYMLTIASEQNNITRKLIVE